MRYLFVWTFGLAFAAIGLYLLPHIMLWWCKRGQIDQ